MHGDVNFAINLYIELPCRTQPNNVNHLFAFIFMRILPKIPERHEQCVITVYVGNAPSPIIFEEHCSHNSLWRHCAQKTDFEECSACGVSVGYSVYHSFEYYFIHLI